MFWPYTGRAGMESKRKYCEKRGEIKDIAYIHL
jgi:hypothetical protein